jgi:hypothetical protein
MLEENKELREQFRAQHLALIEQVKAGKITATEALAQVAPADADNFEDALEASGIDVEDEIEVEVETESTNTTQN